jgi:hypothetical protein
MLNYQEEKDILLQGMVDKFYTVFKQPNTERDFLSE